MRDQRKKFSLLVLVFFIAIGIVVAEKNDESKSFYESGKNLLTSLFQKIISCLASLTSKILQSISFWNTNKDDPQTTVTNDPKNSNSTNSNESGTAKEKKKIEDCLGLNNKLAEKLDSWLKGNTNSTFDVRAKFFIKTRNNFERIAITKSDESNIENIKFNITLPTFVIVHGYLSSGTTDWIIDMENALLQWENANVVAVDWSDQYFSYNYFKVARSIETVGNQITTFFIKLRKFSVNKYNLEPENLGKLHCIGHSLGSHVCGFAAYEMNRRKSFWKFDRVTGLDPAKPCFEVENTILRLDRDDAPYVDVIHTNSRESITEGLSLFESLGHFDFYPNGGKSQPGCSRFSLPIPSTLKVPIESLGEAVCEHGMAYLYFTESIRNHVAKNCTFWGQPWDYDQKTAENMDWDSCNDETCMAMGINSEKYYKGKNQALFVLTSGTAPFCQIATKKEEKGIKKNIKY